MFLDYIRYLLFSAFVFFFISDYPDYEEPSGRRTHSTWRRDTTTPVSVPEVTGNGSGQFGLRLY